MFDWQETQFFMGKCFVYSGRRSQIQQIKSHENRSSHACVISIRKNRRCYIWRYVTPPELSK